MKANAIVAILLVTAATSAHARFAWLYPRKVLSPDESGQWIVMNRNPWSHETKADVGTVADRQSRSGNAPPTADEGDREKRSSLKCRSTKS